MNLWYNMIGCSSAVRVFRNSGLPDISSDTGRRHDCGKEHFTYRKRRANERLKGVRLKGTVRRAEMESIYIRLDMDKEEKADYPWPWVPETGNLCYCIPEIGTEVMLYFPAASL